MISKKMHEELNAQINAELYSSYLYLSMAAYFSSNNYSGFSNWMKFQSREEYGHAMKLYTYLIELGAKVELQQIEKPQSEWSSPVEVFEASLKHEQMVTGRINNLMNLAIEDKDHATSIFLQWFITEQVEEEAAVASIVEKFKMIGDNKSALYMLDRELGTRPA